MSLRVLYLYSGTRNDKFKGKFSRDFPDTQFYGLNHLYKFGIKAQFKDQDDIVKNVILKKFLGFRLRHFFSYFTIKGYNVVFGSSLLYPLFFQKIFRRKTKFMLLNISITRTLYANRQKPLKLIVIKWLLKEISAVVCLSSTQKKYLERQCPFLKGHIYFVPLGVDAVYHKPIYDKRRNYILSAGRDNGRDYKAVMEVALLMPEREFHIVCSPRNIKDIQNVPCNVKVFLDLPPKELYEKYKKAQLLLLLTKGGMRTDGADCSGQTVLLDAMANGLPVVVTEQEYLSDYARDGKEIIYVHSYDPKEIKTYIEKMRDTQIRKDLAKKARRRVEEELTTEKMAKGLARVFIK